MSSLKVNGANNDSKASRLTFFTFSRRTQMNKYMARQPPHEPHLQWSQITFG